MWDLPRPGLEPVSPALGGGPSTTVPPGKPPGHFNFIPPKSFCLGVFFAYILTLFSDILFLRTWRGQPQPTDYICVLHELRKASYAFWSFEHLMLNLLSSGKLQIHLLRQEEEKIAWRVSKIELDCISSGLMFNSSLFDLLWFLPITLY